MNSNESEFDLSTIEPSLHERVKERLSAIEEYENDPRKGNAVRLAKQVGLGRSQFFNLVRAWRNLRDPRKLAGMENPRARKIELDAAQRGIVDAAMRGAPEASPDEITAIAMAEGAAHGVEMPLKEKVRRYVHAQRPRVLPRDLAARGDILVGHTVLEPGVDIGGGRLERPLATMVVVTDRNAVAGLELTLGRRTASTVAEALHSVIESLPPGRSGISSVGLPNLDDPDFGRLCASLERAGLAVNVQTLGRYEHGRCIEALLGLRHEGIRFRPRLVDAGRERRTIASVRPLPPLTLGEVAAMAVARLEISPQVDAIIAITPERRSDLLRDLKALSGA